MSPLSRRTRLRALLIFSFVMLIAFGWISSQHASSGAGPINPPSQVAAEKSIINPEATIVVNSLADTASPTDGLCTLREAMTAANNNAASGGVAGECAAGGAGTDVIDLSGLTGTISLTSQPPSITSDMSITGPPSRLITITRSSVSSFRILTVGSGVVATISNLAITNGDAPTGGGGIFNLGTLTVTNCDVSGNTASSSSFGGGINNQGTLRIVGSLISNNTSVFGAGIYNHTNTLIMQNSTVSGNHDQGIIVNGNAWLINCTITANDGVGVGNSGTTHLRNTIIAGNNGSVDVTSFFASDGNNLIGKSDGTNNLTNGVNGDKVGSTGSPLNPQLASLADNGGPTKTHALLSNSPAIDSGNDCVTQAAHCGDVNVAQVTTDQRGSARNLDGDANGTSTTDIGAYEFGGILVNNTNDSGAGSLRQAVADANASATPLTIVFSIPSTDSGCPGGVCTITLTSGELLLSQNMAIQGPGTGLLTISGNNSSRVFNIQGGKTASLRAANCA